MPALMTQLNYPRAKEVTFQYQHGANINARIEGADVYGTLYFPDPRVDFYRASITGDRLTIEFASNDAIGVTFSANNCILDVLRDFGISGGLPVVRDVVVSDQKYAKILPIDDAVRKHFIIWASDNFSIYSLGRFATWRPGLLLDDVVNDVRVIQRILASGHSYDERKAT
jgi:hypothetical protein